MTADLLQKAIDDLPAGRWAVGVSGGADSVALLLLLMRRSDLSLHVVHLDHETRDGESAVDAVFVGDLAKRLHLPHTIERRSAIEVSMHRLASNTSSRYRLARIALFQKVILAENLQGVLLAHHADDQAETVLLRLLRGSAPANLVGIRARAIVHGMLFVRPLLVIDRQQLRAFLKQRGEIWREDSSNESDDYQRNRLRHWLANRPEVRTSLLQLEASSSTLRDWLNDHASKLDESFSIDILRDLPLAIARHAATQWLIDRGSPPRKVSNQTAESLVAMCTDAASPPRQHFPGRILVRRKRGVISASR